MRKLPVSIAALLLSVTAGAQSTAVRVVVRDASALTPVSTADVQIPALGLVSETDSLGRSVFPSVQTGLWRIAVRHVGFSPVSQTIVVGLSDSMDVFVGLSRTGTTLDTVVVRGREEYPYLAEFNLRKKMGLGRFLTGAQLDSARAESAADFASRRFSGIRAVWSPGRSTVALQTRRGYRSFGVRSRAVCTVLVYIDGMQASSSDVANIRATDLAGIEFYSNAAPVQYARAGSDCGVMLLWSRQ